MMPLLETQPSYCTIPGVCLGLPCLHAAGAQLPARQGGDDKPLNADPEGRWVDLPILVGSVFNITYWSDADIVQLVQQHMPDCVKDCVRQEVLVPLAAAPYLKHWLLTCLGTRAQKEYELWAGTPHEQRCRLEWARQLREVEKEDFEAIASAISRDLY